MKNLPLVSRRGSRLKKWIGLVVSKKALNPQKNYETVRVLFQKVPKRFGPISGTSDNSHCIKWLFGAFEKRAVNQVVGLKLSCLLHFSTDLCDKQGVNGYPTIKYYKFGTLVVEYDGDRTEKDFVVFMKAPPQPLPPDQPDSGAEDTRDEL